LDHGVIKVLSSLVDNGRMSSLPGSKRQVLMFNGSPRTAGNTSRALEIIKGELESYGDVQVETVHIKELDLELCHGCFTCISRGEQHCPLKDRREEMEKRMMEADGIVLASPLHVQNVSWLMKNFIDRFCYTNHRLRFFHQKVMLVAVGGMDLRTTIRAMRPALGGAQIVSELSFQQLGWQQSPKAEAKKLTRLKGAVKDLHDSLGQEGLPRPKVVDLIRFRFLKKISSEVPDVLPADHAFYADKERYYYEVRIGVLRSAAASFMVRLIMYLSRDLEPYSGEKA
jgi:NAD(P)H-dependent FMN reductase